MIYVKADIDKFSKDLHRLYSDQIPYIAAVTLTRLAQGSQDDLKGTLTDYFTIRNPSRIKAGVRIEAARKADFRSGAMHSVVKDIDSFMELQAEGGTKKPRKTKNISIPTDEFLNQGIRTATGSIKARFKPRALLRGSKEKPRKWKWGRIRKPKPFVFKGRWGNAVAAVRQSREKYPLLYLYNFNPTTKIPKRWPFLNRVESYVGKNAATVFTREFEKAIATRR